MIRGVSFEVLPNDNVLLQVLKSIDVEKFDWYNIDSQNEVRYKPFDDVFFEKDFYSGKDFLNKISSSQYIVVFIKLQAYLKNGVFSDIESYDDFLKSGCQLLLLMWDCSYVRIYAKDEVISQAVFENAILNHYTDVMYLTQSNDGRRSMNVI